MKQTTLDKHFNVVYKNPESRSQNDKTKKDVPSKKKRNSCSKRKNSTPVQSVRSEHTTDCIITYESITVTESRCVTPTRTASACVSQSSQSESSISATPRRSGSYAKSHSSKHVKSFTQKVTETEDDISPSKKYKIGSARCLETEIEAEKSAIYSTPCKEPIYSPKVSSPKAANRFASRSPPDVDMGLAKCAIEQMNFVKQGAIPPNNFDLEKIYSKPTFRYRYSAVNTKTAQEYEFDGVKVPPDEMYAKIVFNAIVTVLANPVNCGYFSERELDFVYSILTLSPYALVLLGRMLKRVRTWHRGSSIKYSDIPNIQGVFRELESKSICSCDATRESFSVLLKLLQANEVSDICKTLKIRNNGKKQTNIDALESYLNMKFFPGAKGPDTILRSLIMKKIGYCVRLTHRMWGIFDKILTLLMPNRDAQLTTADTIYVLFQVYAKKMKFPKIPAQQFPIFSCQEHLRSYTKAKAALTNTLNFILNKKWEEVTNLGDLAEKEWLAISKAEFSRLKNSTLPTHVKYFMPGYVWLKVLSESVDAYKKKHKDRAVQVLRLLLEQECHMKNRRSQWYAELVLIQMHHKKDIQEAANIIMQGLWDENLTRVGKVDLIEKAERILKKKTGVENDTKRAIKSVLEDIADRVMPKYIITENTIDGTVRTRSVAGLKSKWLVESDAESQSYGSVESFALTHYLNDGFSNGVHCEGALPVLLFSTLFWEELYDINVPGAFVTQYQDAPQDLYFDQFYENRKEKIDMKLQIVRGLDSETLSNIMEDKFNVCSAFQSVMPPALFRNTTKDAQIVRNSQLREVVYCLGVEAVVGICERLIENFKLWRAGFPDLFVWNFQTKEYKIVEVKGPNDTLSTKQKLWFEYLYKLGLNVELCWVKDTSNSR